MIKHLDDFDFKNKKVLVRVDFNVPLQENGKIGDLTRIKESIPTIQYILDKGGSVILMSHLGRPKGEKDIKYSLAPCAKALSELIHLPVKFATDCIGPEAEKLAASLRSKEILLLENLRFHSAEEEPDGDPTFAKKLAHLGDIYINDAFGTAHRAHSSTTAITQHFPKEKGAGLLLMKELFWFEKLLKEPKRPFYAMIGGSKVSSKFGVLTALLSKVDALFVGGGMAFTFFKAKGIPIGASLHEDDLILQAKQFLQTAKEKNVPLYLPEDIIIANQFAADADSKTISVETGIPDSWQGMDIGPQTVKNWSRLLEKAKTIFWNGPLGVFEFPKFGKGTFDIAKNLVNMQASTIVGGGDSVAAIQSLGLSASFAHVSTGGGASLEMIEYGHLPGVDSLIQ